MGRSRGPDVDSRGAMQRRLGLALRLVLLVACLCHWRVVRCISEPVGTDTLLRPEEPPVEGTVDIVRYKAGYERARTEQDLQQLFKDNLDADLTPFRHSKWNISDFTAFVRRFNNTVPRHTLGEGNAALVMIRNGSVSVSWLRGKDNHWRFACLRAAVHSARALKVPNSAFILNIDDFPICKPGLCPLPVFTMYKKWGPHGNIDTNEVLMPVFNHHYEDLYVFDWHKKREKAFMRASQQGCMAVNSSRTMLALASEEHPERLDLGITRMDGATKHDLKYLISKAGFVRIEDHAKWKYLVSADGCVAQTRLAKVMLTNSVVIKEDSQWIEYYYRSLRPWQHYAPFQSGATAGEEVLDIVNRLRANDKKAQQIAETAQKWAYRYLSQYPRLLYFKRMIIEYNKIFGGEMEKWVQQGGPEKLLQRRRKHTRRTRAQTE
eukprot:jgi/Chrzof1/9184/Cz03g39020.t1